MSAKKALIHIAKTPNMENFNKNIPNIKEIREITPIFLTLNIRAVKIKL